MMQRKIEAVILANEFPGDHSPWINACKEYPEKINFRVVRLMDADWLDKIKAQNNDILLLKPGGITTLKRKVYVDRVSYLHRDKGIPVFPSLDEILIYEDKKYFSTWCKNNGIPTPATFLFDDPENATRFVIDANYPLVAKTALGASGSGVKIIRQADEAMKYLNDAFSIRGVKRRSGPDLNKGDLVKRASKYLVSPSEILGKIKLYIQRANDRQRGFVIFQEYIPHDFEWRVVRIGDSFFAHKKLASMGKASGSLLKNYDDPPLELLSFVKGITDRHKFFSQAVDLFETPQGYLVNEMQCIFGQSDPYQMKVGGIPGRYLFRDERWIFEGGDFARNQCYNLRIEWVIKMFQ